MDSNRWIGIEAGHVALGNRLFHFPDLQVGAGEVIAVVGKNGVGKSVWLRHLMGWLTPAAGKISSVLWNQKNQMAWVNNHRESFADLWVEDVITLGEHSQDKQGIEAVLLKFDLKAKREQSIQTLSDGEWMRVRMARLFYHQPSVILMDEPSAHLDFEYKIGWEGWVKELQTLGSTIICATHDLQWASEAAHKVWWIQDDQLIEMQHPHFHPHILIKKDK
jgi:ABC-type cobalamin/Fe3+-siderophores transport system ATPase subunit